MSELYHNAIFVTSAERMPPGEHWAIIEFDSVTIPGDQRSRDAPGHGYPEHSEPTVEYRAFLKREDFEAELRDRAGRYSYKKFRCIHVAAQVVATPIYALEEKR